MPRLFKLFAAALALAAMGLISEPAEARKGRNAAAAAGIAAGVIGGLAAGALLANPGPAYGAPVIVDPPPYEEAPVYHRPSRVYVEPEPVCRTVRRRVWLDEETYTYRRVRVCD